MAAQATIRPVATRATRVERRQRRQLLGRRLRLLGIAPGNGRSSGRARRAAAARPPRAAAPPEIRRAEIDACAVKATCIAVAAACAPLMGHGRYDLWIWAVCLAAALYTGLVLRAALTGRPRWAITGLFTTLVDTALCGAMIYATGGLRSEFYPAYYLVALVAAVRFGQRMGLVASGAVAASYLAVAWGTGGLTSPGTTATLAVRLTFVLAISELAGVLVNRVEEGRRSLHHSYDATLRGLSAALDQRDVETHSHSSRVVGFALRLGREMGLGEEELMVLGRGAMLHDIGKIGVPDGILRKPGPLDEAEWSVMRRHPEIGRDILAGIPFLAAALPVVVEHHERWDGTGYPAGRHGEGIHLGARIFAVADAYDAMTSDRPYRRARPHASAVAELQRCSGAQFDPEAVRAFVRVGEAEWRAVAAAAAAAAPPLLSAGPGDWAEAPAPGPMPAAQPGPVAVAAPGRR